MNKKTNSTPRKIAAERLGSPEAYQHPHPTPKAILQSNCNDFQRHPESDPTTPKPETGGLTPEKARIFKSRAKWILRRCQRVDTLLSRGLPLLRAIRKTVRASTAPRLSEKTLYRYFHAWKAGQIKDWPDCMPSYQSPDKSHRASRKIKRLALKKAPEGTSLQHLHKICGADRICSRHQFRRLFSSEERAIFQRVFSQNRTMKNRQQERRDLIDRLNKRLNEARKQKAS